MFAEQRDPDPLRIVSSANLSQNAIARAVRKLVGDEVTAELRLAQVAIRSLYNRYKQVKEIAERRLQALIALSQVLDIGDIPFTEGKPDIRAPKWEKMKKDELKAELDRVYSFSEDLITRLAKCADLTEIEILWTGQKDIHDNR